MPSTGYVVVLEGDEESGYSAYCPDLPGAVAAERTRPETQALMVGVLAAHISVLREMGVPVPVPVPVEHADAVILDIPAA